MEKTLNKDKAIDDLLLLVAKKNKRIKELEESEKMLRALEAAGVDNWQGYELALESLEA